MAFNRDRNFQRGGFKKDFNDRESRGPVTMHQATCSKCGKECEVPFRPTSGKPVYCNNCFDRPRDSESSGRSESRFSNRPSYGDRQGSSERTEDFETVCDECGKTCTVPFHPTAGKPVYCRNCFGEKKNSGEKNTEGNNDRAQFESLNAKLDKILKLLAPEPVKATAPEEIIKGEVAIEPKIEKKVSKPKKKKPVKK